MTKDQILDYLKELRDSLPTSAFVNGDLSKSELIDSETQRLVEEEDKLKSLLDLDSNEVRNAEIDNLTIELEDTYDEIETKKIDLASTIKTTELYSNDLKAIEHRIAVNEKLLSRASDDNTKKNVMDKIEEDKSEIEKYKDWIDESKEAETKTNKLISELEVKIQYLLNRLDAERKIEIKNIADRYDEAYNKRLSDVKYLRSKLGFLNVDVIPMLNSLIDDYSNGRTNESEVGYRMQLLKYNISDPLINKLTQSMSDEQAMLSREELDSINSNIDFLENKLSDDNNYIISEDDYIKQYNELNAAYKKANRAYENNRVKFDNIINEINNIDETLTDYDLNETSRNSLIKERNRYQNSLQKLKDRFVASSAKVTAIDDKIKYLTSNHGRVDEVLKESDLAKLDELKLARDKADYYSKINYISINERIDRLINNTLDTSSEYYNLGDITPKSYEETQLPGVNDDIILLGDGSNNKIVESKTNNNVINDIIQEPIHTEFDDGVTPTIEDNLNKPNNEVIAAPTIDGNLKEPEKEVVVAPSIKDRVSLPLIEKVNPPKLTSEDLKLNPPTEDRYKNLHNHDNDIVGVREANPTLKSKLKKILRRAAIALVIIAAALGITKLVKSVNDEHKYINPLLIEEEVVPTPYKPNYEPIHINVQPEITPEPTVAPTPTLPPTPTPPPAPTPVVEPDYNNNIYLGPNDFIETEDYTINHDGVVKDKENNVVDDLDLNITWDGLSEVPLENIKPVEEFGHNNNQQTDSDGITWTWDFTTGQDENLGM